MGTKYNFEEKSTRILKAWLYDHQNKPYPLAEEVEELSIEANLDISQVKIWFTTARQLIKQQHLKKRDQKSVKNETFKTINEKPKEVSDSVENIQNKNDNEKDPQPQNVACV